MIYPAVFTSDDNGSVVIEVTDVSGVVSFGANHADALVMGQDALLTMFDYYMQEGRPIPAPSAPAPGQPVVEVPAMASVKLAIYDAMRDQGISQVRLSSLLKTSPKAVRRLLDLWHNSRWDHLEAALAVLGLQVAVEIRKNIIPAPQADYPPQPQNTTVLFT